MHEGANEETNSDDLEVEISDLPDPHQQEPRGHQLMVRLEMSPVLRRRLGNTALATCSLLLVCLVVFGVFPDLSSRLSGLFVPPASTPPATIGSQNETQGFSLKKVLFWRISTPPSVPLNGTLEAVPQTCRRYTSLQNFDAPAYPAGVGGSPLWVTGFSGPRALLDHFVRATPPRFGWYERLTLVMATNYASPITLRGGTIVTSAPLWFGVYPHNLGLITYIVVNPADLNASNHFSEDQSWTGLPIALYIAHAGCYYLQANWAGGSWIAFFAAGK